MEKTKWVVIGGTIGAIVGGILFVVLDLIIHSIEGTAGGVAGDVATVIGIIGGIIGCIIGSTDSGEKGCLGFGCGGIIIGAIVGAIIGGVFFYIPIKASIMLGATIGIIVGTIIGASYGNEISEEQYMKDIEEAKEAALKKEEDEKIALWERQGYASDFQKKYKSVIDKCKLDISKVIPSHTYKSVDAQKGIWDMANNISLNLQRIESTVEELNAKEGK